MTMTGAEARVVIVGGGIGGLTAALELERVGVRSVVAEAVRDFAPVGVGITILPHAAEVLGLLGLEDALAGGSILTRHSAFYNRFGQLVYREPAGRAAGYTSPQYSIHRGHLHEVLRGAVVERLGDGALLEGYSVEAVEEEEDHAVATVSRWDGGTTRLCGEVVVGADGIHSAVRRQLFPGEGAARYTGITMWRGTTVWPPFLDGATMIRVGCIETGQLVAYPLANDVDGSGRQLVNWVVELATPQRSAEGWNVEGHVEEFIEVFDDWHLDWLDVPGMLRAAERVLTYPMVDRAPLKKWTFGRVTLLGDAAHPMVPRGSNGAGQTILDARCLAEAVGKSSGDLRPALRAYEARRRPATSAVVEANHVASPDAILTRVHERSGGRPFERVEDLLPPKEAEEILSRYRSIAGY